MDTDERTVLRRKVPVIAEILNFSPQSQKEYHERGLLTDEMLTKILVEKTNKNQIYRYLDLLTKNNDLEDPFSKLLEFLESQGHRWIRFEMSADLKAERLELMVDEYVYRESGILVHSHFGQCARISEIDKKDIQLMLSWRYQIAKEAWSSQLESCENDIKELLTYQQISEERIKSADQQIKAFLEENVKYLDSRAASLLNISRERNPKSATKLSEEGLSKSTTNTSEEWDPQTTTHISDEGGPKPNTMISEEQDLKATTTTCGEQSELVLGEYFGEFMKMLQHSAQRFIDLEEERQRCAFLLKTTDPSMPLDIALRHKLYAEEKLRLRAQEEAEIAKENVVSMAAELNAIKAEAANELEEKEKGVMRMKVIVNKANAKNKELATITTDFQRKRKESLNDAKTWRERCLMLEKTRKLGYFHPGWYEKLYGICDVHYVRDTDESKRPPTDKIISPQCRCLTSPMTRPKSAAGVTSGVMSRSSTVSMPANRAGPPKPKTVTRNSTDQVKINPHGKQSEYSTVKGLKNVSGTWKEGRIVLKKNDFSKNDRVDVESPPNKTACNGMKCNYLYDSSKNRDKLQKNYMMSTI